MIVYFAAETLFHFSDSCDLISLSKLIISSRLFSIEKFNRFSIAKYLNKKFKNK